ncbi:MAG: DUF5995 family protein [Spirosomataceae bacterium]
MKTIDDVVSRLSEIVLWAEQKQSAMGYFASLYRSMTLAVQDGIKKGSFEDGPRMEALDVRFAKRYIDAFDAYQAGKRPTASWQKAFDAAKNNRITVIQHLMLGINAHINLDLAIAAAETAPNEQILLLQADFDKINSIIANLTGKVQDKLAQIWLPFRLMDDLLKTEDEGMVNFSITVARKFSWASALLLAPMNPTQKAIQIGKMDQTVVQLADKIINPGWLISSALWTVRMGESGTINERIKVLSL